MTGTTANALAFARGEHAKPSQSWARLCLSFVRNAWQLPGVAPTAYAAWLAVDAGHRHEGGNPDDAPLGAALFFKGSDAAGHVDLAGNPFPSGLTGAWSNDLVTEGHIDKVSRTAPVTAWGHRYLGWTSELNGFELPVGMLHIPAKPKHPHRYLVVKQTIERLQAELDKGDLTASDRKGLRLDVKRLHKLYAELTK